MKKEKLKIGLFLDSYFPNIDGVVMVVDNLAKELSKTNNVTVIVPMTETYKEDKNRPYKVIRIKSYNVPFTEYKTAHIVSKYSKEYKSLKEENFNIIHIHSPFEIGMLGVKLAKEQNIPCLATMHTRFEFEFKRIVKNQLLVKGMIKKIIKVYNKCDRCIAVNNAIGEVFKGYGYKYQPTVIYNGTDLISYKEETLSSKLKKILTPKEETIFLFVGRIINIKNIFFILDSLKLLKEDNIKFKMLYVGTGPDEKALQRKIKEYNMEDCVFLTGKITNRKELSTIYKKADLFLFPSLFDASSLVQIEAAINETPGLFIENSVTADTITNNVNGFTSKLDVKDYKNRIKEIIKDKNNLKRVAINAKKTLGKSWKEIAKETSKLYKNEIAKKE